MLIIILAVAGLLPIMWSTSTGSEVMRPLATPVIGGMLLSLIHILVVTPVLFAWLRERELRSPLESTGPAQFSTPQPAQLQLVVGNGPAQTRGVVEKRH